MDLAYVACGRQDAYFEYRLKPWDYAAGGLIVVEAGGVLKDIGKSLYHIKMFRILQYLLMRI